LLQITTQVLAYGLVQV